MWPGVEVSTKQVRLTPWIPCAMKSIAVVVAALLGVWGGYAALISRRWARGAGILLLGALCLGGVPAAEAWTRPAVSDARTLLREVVCPLLPTPSLQRRCRNQINTAPTPAVVLPSR
jgi:hypothetical protein